MSVCAHDPYCPGQGLDHDTWLKFGTTTEREGRRSDESIKAWKRRERAERNARSEGHR